MCFLNSSVKNSANSLLLFNPGCIWSFPKSIIELKKLWYKLIENNKAPKIVYDSTYKFLKPRVKKAILDDWIKNKIKKSRPHSSIGNEQ